MPTIQIDPLRDALGVIDVQPTFMPGGDLPVPDGAAVIAPINRLLAAPFAQVFATQDWHPAGHSSFASAHPGRQPFEVIEQPYGPQCLWPDHALQDTESAALHPGLRRDRIDFVVQKGTRPAIDSYSAFVENDGVTRTGLAERLRALGIERVFFAGLAIDYCAGYSAEHAAQEGFASFLVIDASRAIATPTVDGRTTLDDTLDRLAASGVTLVRTDDIVGHA